MGSNKEARVVVLQLPEDVLMKILSRLDVKDLIRFKSVCKTWFRLISSQYFIQLHLKKSSFRIIRLTHFYDHRLRVEFSGSCDGLVCLYDAQYEMIHIWNPAMHIVKCIPIKRPPHDVICYWFGRIGDEDDEYELILGTTSHMHLIRLYIDNDSWKSTQVRKNYFYSRKIGTLFNGIIHWHAFERSWDFTYVPTIVSYDSRNDAIGEISPPETINRHFIVGEVYGYLSIMSVNFETMEFEIWAMKEYGVKESWTKLMSLRSDYVFHHRVKSQELILDDPAKVKSPLYTKFMYVESLVFPKPRDRVVCPMP